MDMRSAQALKSIRQERPPALLVLALVLASALSPLAINIFIPSMASIAGDLSASASTVALGLSLYLVTVAAVQLIAGPLSDRYGRRPVMLAGMVLFLIGTLMCIYADSAALFLAGRIVQAGSATGIVVSRAIVRDLFARDRAASMIGYVTMGLAVAPLIGPAIGGIMDSAFGWQSVFWLLAAFGVVTLAMIVAKLPETAHSIGAPVLVQFGAYRLLLRSAAFWRYAGTATLISAVFFAFLGGAPFIASHRRAMSPAGYGIWFMACSLGYILGNFLTGRLSSRLGIERLMRAGTWVSFLATLPPLVLFLGGHLSAAALFLPMLLVGLGNGLAVPTSTAGGVSVRPQAAGAAAGLLGAVQIGGGAAASAMASALSHSHVAVAALMAVFGIGAVLCAHWRPSA